MLWEYTQAAFSMVYEHFLGMDGRRTGKLRRGDLEQEVSRYSVFRYQRHAGKVLAEAVGT